MDSFPPLFECVQALIYPPCLVAGLFGGLVTRRWWLAALLAFMIAPVIDLVLGMAFSDAHPRFVWQDALVFGVAGALVAVMIRGVARLARRSRTRSARP